MSDANENRLNDPKLDADLARLADEDRDAKPPRVGSAEAPDAIAPDVERESVGGDGAPRSSVEGVDEAGAERDAIRDTTR